MIWSQAKLWLREAVMGQTKEVLSFLFRFSKGIKLRAYRPCDRPLSSAKTQAGKT